MTRLSRVELVVFVCARATVNRHHLNKRYKPVYQASGDIVAVSPPHDSYLPRVIPPYRRPRASFCVKTQNVTSRYSPIQSGPIQSNPLQSSVAISYPGKVKVVTHNCMKRPTSTRFHNTGKACQYMDFL